MAGTESLLPQLLRYTLVLLNDRLRIIRVTNQIYMTGKSVKVVLSRQTLFNIPDGGLNNDLFSGNFFEKIIKTFRFAPLRCVLVM